jgi:hypothetical protein
MLKIRTEQIQAFQPLAEEGFEWRVVDYIKTSHAQVSIQLLTGRFTVSQLPDATLHTMVREGIRRARAYGMTWQSTITSFVVLMFVTAPNFDEHPLIKRVLKDERIKPDLRIEQLWEQTKDQNWRAAEQMYDPSAWLVQEPGGKE